MINQPVSNTDLSVRILFGGVRYRIQAQLINARPLVASKLPADIIQRIQQIGGLLELVAKKEEIHSLEKMVVLNSSLFSSLITPDGDLEKGKRRFIGLKIGLEDATTFLDKLRNDLISAQEGAELSTIPANMHTPVLQSPRLNVMEELKQLYIAQNGEIGPNGLTLEKIRKSPSSLDSKTIEEILSVESVQNLSKDSKEIFDWFVRAAKRGAEYLTNSRCQGNSSHTSKTFDYMHFMRWVYSFVCPDACKSNSFKFISNLEVAKNISSCMLVYLFSDNVFVGDVLGKKRRLLSLINSNIQIN